MKHRATPPPWWRVGIVWLVIGATVAVMAAGVWMVRVSRAGADVVMVEPAATAGPRVPAMQGRNHVATPPP